MITGWGRTGCSVGRLNVRFGSLADSLRSTNLVCLTTESGNLSAWGGMDYTPQSVPAFIHGYKYGSK
jgi:hypothetical protein